LTYRKPFSVQTEKTKRKERAVEDAIEKIYGFGVIVFAKNLRLRFNIEKSGKYKILLLSKTKIV
jgi:hypothetical protein